MIFFIEKILLLKNSGIFKNLFLITLHNAFKLLGEQLDKTLSTIINSSEESLPLPKLLPNIKKQFQVILEPQNGVHSYLQALFEIPELEESSYEIFTKSYDEY